uniref:Pseudouridine-5'-phosphate glycosidase n=1 Tax=Panagrolaimus sp. ES5 TaxID=591445 RepID=A0AC34GQA6_9BILA
MFRFSKTLFHQSLSSRLILGEEVAEALAAHNPIVALESTVITHGLPSPHNFETAKLLENTIRKENVIPATIALINGKIKVGLTKSELEMISDPKIDATKVSVRDIANVLVKKAVGGTTVAATMRIAHACGIRVFATGGIGGVHRGAEDTFDISADLIELGKTPIAVVCAGAKSILDIPKTLEFLETQSCNVIVYGNDKNFPGFFTPKTQYFAPMNSTNVEEIAEILALTDLLNLQQGTLIACPLPEKYSAAGDEIESVIQTAVKECKELKISSKEVTPFILKRVNEMTKGKSMETNIALLQNNAQIAAKIAKYYSKLTIFEDNNENSKEEPATTKPYTVKSKKSESVAKVEENEIKKPKVLCIGAAIIDFEVITNENVKVGF